MDDSHVKHASPATRFFAQKNMREKVQALYDWLLESSSDLKERCDGDSPPRVRLRIRSKAVEGAFEVNLQFFDTDQAYLPATALPIDHRKTIVSMMRPPPGVGTSFRLVRAEKPGSTTMVWDLCVFDEEIEVKDR